MQIDVLVKNKKHVKLKKNIRRIFRQYNIIEYKSLADELTITFVCYHYPRNMLRKLEQDRKMAVEQEDSGIYYLVGDAIPI